MCVEKDLAGATIDFIIGQREWVHDVNPYSLPSFKSLLLELSPSILQSLPSHGLARSSSPNQHVTMPVYHTIICLFDFSPIIPISPTKIIHILMRTSFLIQILPPSTKIIHILMRTSFHIQIIPPSKSKEDFFFKREREREISRYVI